MYIKLDKNKRDLYPNAPMGLPDKFGISEYYMKKLSGNVKKCLDDFVLKVDGYTRDKWRSLPGRYKIAFKGHIEDLAHFISDVGGDSQKVEDIRRLTERESVYVGDVLARITKRVLNITKKDHTKAKDILEPLEPFTKRFFDDEGIEKMISDISEEEMTEVDQIMKNWREP